MNKLFGWSELGFASAGAGEVEFEETFGDGNVGTEWKGGCWGMAEDGAEALSWTISDCGISM